VFLIVLAGIFLLGYVNSCRTDWYPMEQWCSDCKVTISCSESSSSTLRSPPIDLPLPLRRSGPNLSSSGVRFQAAREVLSCAFNLVYCLSYWDPPKDPKIYTFWCPITFWAFANLIFRIVLLSLCPSQSHTTSLGHVLNLVWVLHLNINSFCITSSHLVRNCLCPVWYFDHISLIQTRILVFLYFMEILGSCV
jgi:hypothetical protein